MHGDEPRARTDVCDARARLQAERLDELVGTALGVEPRLLVVVDGAATARAFSRGLLALVARARGRQQGSHRQREPCTHSMIVAEKANRRPLARSAGRSDT